MTYNDTMKDTRKKSVLINLRRRIRAYWRRYLWFWQQDYHWPIIAGLAILALILGYIGFRKYFAALGETRSHWDIFYLTIQLFVLESDIIAGPAPWELVVTRFLAPVVPAWTALKTLSVVFRNQLQRYHLRHMSGHVVICGLGRKGLQLVKDFRDAGEQVVVVEIDEGNAVITTCRDLGAMVLIGSATDKSLLHRARVHCAKYIFATCGNDGTNVEIAVLSYQLVHDRKAVFTGIVCCFVHVVDLQLCELFKYHKIFTEAGDPFEVRIFNVYENSARLLLENYPLDLAQITARDPRTVHLMVVGFGQMGESVVLQAAKTGHYANAKKLRIMIIDKQADEKRRTFCNRYPQFDKICETTFLQGDVEIPAIREKIHEWAKDDRAIMTVVICLDGDSRGLSCALSLLSTLKEYKIPIIVRMAENTGLATLLERGRGRPDWTTHVHSFGILSLTSTRDMLLHEKIDFLARKIHADYVTRRKKKLPDTDPAIKTDSALRDWDKLDQSLKDSNRQQAAHIPVKLRAIGCYSAPAGKSDQSFDGFRKKEVEILAKMEHARWMAERLLVGWTLGPKDIEKKRSPYLIDWQKLTNEIKEHDHQAVHNIPHLLALIGEKIYRKPDAKPVES